MLYIFIIGLAIMNIVEANFCELSDDVQSFYLVDPMGAWNILEDQESNIFVSTIIYQEYI